MPRTPEGTGSHWDGSRPLASGPFDELAPHSHPATEAFPYPDHPGEASDVEMLVVPLLGLAANGSSLPPTDEAHARRSGDSTLEKGYGFIEPSHWLRREQARPITKHEKP